MKQVYRLFYQRHPALKFALVGTAGLLVDSLVMLCLYQFLDIDLLLARRVTPGKPN